MQRQPFKDVLDNRQLIKKETQSKVFSCGLLRKFKDTFFHRAPLVATYVRALNIPSLKMRSLHIFLACNS